MQNLSKKFQNLPEIKSNVTFPFSSEGEFSMHELIQFLLQKTGPASVCVSSFSISEVAIRAFYNLMENEVITSLKCILDLSVKRHKLGLLYFLSNINIDIAITKNHAKYILIENENWNICVVGTANLQVNDKKEVGVISTDPRFFNFFHKTFNNWFSKGLLISRDEFE